MTRNTKCFLRQALEGGDLTESVLADEKDILGVTGVPAFIAERQAARTGVQPVENLKQLVEYVRAPMPKPGA